MTLNRKMRRALRRFARDEGGFAAADMILLFPLYLFSIMGVYTYWDAWDVINRSQKAAYTVSDLITREMNPVTNAYVTGLFTMMDYMMGDDMPTDTRVTSIFYNGALDRYEVIWSRSSGGPFVPLTNTTVTSIRSDLPDMADGDAVVVVETSTEFEPLFGEGMSLFVEELAGSREHVVVTRPRFVPKICMVSVACG